MKVIRFLVVAVLSGGLNVAQAADAVPDGLTGVWSGSMTTPDNPWWNSEDTLCFPGCPKLFHDHLGSLLDDPTNDNTPVGELAGKTFGVVIADRMARSTAEGKRLIEASTATENIDMAKFCEPYGFVREAMNALPMRISHRGDHLLIEYEEFNLSRTIWLDGREHPKPAVNTPLGFSTGRFDGKTLIVETTGISGDYLIGLNSPTVHYGRFADGASAVERYVVRDEPRRLVLELTLTDPVTLNEPYVWTKTWLATPDVDLLVDSCEDVPGEMQ
ncbi:MAG: hypothetical protein H6978_08690 [Gammaproteobacteria bacterium]|nr:hypothetical protein [Gammaproteobacteria bacterium]